MGSLLDRFEYALFLSKGLDKSMDESEALNKAIQIIEEILTQDPQNTLILRELAKIYMKSNNIDKTIECLQKVVDIDPEDIYAHRKLAWLYSFKKLYDESLSEYRQVIELDPMDGDARMKALEVYKAKYDKDPERNKYFFKKITELTGYADKNPSDSMASFEAGYAIYVLSHEFKLSEEDKQKAIYYFKQANAADPQNLWPYWGLVKIYLKEASMEGKKTYDMAIELAKKACSIAPNNPRAHFELGETYFQNYERDMKRQAMEEYKRALSLDPEFVLARLMLASIYRSRGDMEKAVEELYKVIEIDPISNEAKRALRMLVHIEKLTLGREAL